MRPRNLVLSGLIVFTTPALPGAAEDMGVSQAAREAWAKARATGADVQALGDPGLFSGVLVTNTANVPVVGLLPLPDLTGALTWGNATGITSEAGIKGLAGVSPQGSAFIAVRNTANATAFVLDGNVGLVSGPTTGDLAEAFPAAVPAVEPGSVMVIDPESPGALRPSAGPYDRRVAGVVAGANDYKPGITLRGLAAMPNQVAVTLTGTVYCLVTSANGPIRAGDLLTTSSIPGHAMRATDGEASRGAILGKAMEDLRGESGRILILASLQ
jgi:hypothetical protein